MSYMYVLHQQILHEQMLTKHTRVTDACYHVMVMETFNLGVCSTPSSINSHVLRRKQGTCTMESSVPSQLREQACFRCVVADAGYETDKTRPDLWQTETALQFKVNKKQRLSLRQKKQSNKRSTHV